MQGNEAFVAVAAILAGCTMLVFLFRYGSQIVRDIFGPPAVGAEDDTASLTQGEVESLIRRAVREEVQPLREKIERIERLVEGGPQKHPRPDLPDGEDPHDFGLIAEEPDTREPQDVA